MNRERLKCEAEAAAYMWLPRSYNSYKQKLTLTALVVVWLILELGTTFTDASPPTSMWWIRAAMMYIVGRAHGIERFRLAEHYGGNQK